jgi:lysophospholipase L1-like esterase
MLNRANVLCAIALLAGLSSSVLARDDEDHDGGRWFSAWTVSHGARQTTPALSGTTVRMIVRPTISGNHLRVKLENTLGTAPVVFSAAYIGVLDTGAALVAGSNRRLAFSGQAGLSLAPGAGAYSDPVRFSVEAFRRLAVSLDVVSASDISAHALGLTTNYSAAGARAASTSADGFTPVPDNAGNFPFYWIAALDVKSRTAAGTVVTFGDSITDGRCSTRDSAGVDHPDLYNRWPDLLAARLAALRGKHAPAVANEAIAGNRVVSGGNGPPALTRLDRDVLDRAGLSQVIFFEGTNDITGGASAATIIDGIQQVINRVHAKGVPIFGVTVVPRGRPAPLTGWTIDMEAQRLAVNHWMHTDANFDALIEFGALMQGPIVASDLSESYWPSWNCGDYTHPNTAGYQAMGSFIDLGLFRNGPAWDQD